MKTLGGTHDDGHENDTVQIREEKMDQSEKDSKI